MKSVLGTFLIFIIIFGLLKMNIIGVLNSTTFHVVSYASLIIVVGCAVYFIGMPSFSKKSKNTDDKTLKERQDKDES